MWRRRPRIQRIGASTDRRYPRAGPERDHSVSRRGALGPHDRNRFPVSRKRPEAAAARQGCLPDYRRAGRLGLGHHRAPREQIPCSSRFDQPDAGAAARGIEQFLSSSEDQSRICASFAASNELNPRADSHGRSADVSDLAQMEAVVRDTRTEFGDIRAVIHAAGVSAPRRSASRRQRKWIRFWARNSLAGGTGADLRGPGFGFCFALLFNQRHLGTRRPSGLHSG